MKIATKILSLLLVLCMMLSLAACVQNSKPNQPVESKPTTPAPSEPEKTEPVATEPNYDGVLVPDGEMKLEYAQNFKVELFKGGYRMITGGAENLSFLVVPEGMKVPEKLDEGVKVLQQPINKMYVASTNMMGLLDELDALSAVKLVATEAKGWYLPNIKAAVENGSIGYSGKYSEPNYEMITEAEIQLHVDTTMVANNPEIGEKFDELGIPTLIENSSVESHPLARIEWVKLFGVILGKEAEAEALFEAKKAIYNSCLDTEGATGKTAALGYITSKGKGYARNGGDYLAQMIGLVGGEYIQKDMKPTESGNSNMTIEEWYDLFKDADYLFYWNLSQKFYSIQEMIDFNPLFADFKAVKEGHVWITAPDWSQTSLTNVMQDMYTIFHSDDPNVTTDHLIKIS